MKVLLPVVAVVVACPWLIAGQFGGGNSVHLPLNDPKVGENMLFVWPFTGIKEVGATQITLDIWARPHSMNPGQAVLVSVANEKTDNWITLNQWYALAFNSPDVLPFGPLAPNKWHHYCITADKEKEVVVMYADGKRVGEMATLINTSDWTLPLSIVIGSDQDQLLGGFDAAQGAAGYFDNLRIWSVVKDVGELFHTDINPSASGLLAAWSFDEGTGLVSHEVAKNRADWSFYFASISYTPEQLMNHQLAKPCEGVKTRVGWAPSGARVFGRTRKMVAATGWTRYLDIEDLAPVGTAITVLGYSGGTLLNKLTQQPVAVGEVVAVNMTWTMLAATGRLEYRGAGGLTTTIEFEHVEPLVPVNMTVEITEDAPAQLTSFFLDAVNPANVEWVPIITSIPARGKVQNEWHNTLLENITAAMEYVHSSSRELNFRPDPNTFATPYATVRFKAVDKGRDSSALDGLPEGTITFNVLPSNDQPLIPHNMSWVLEQDTPLPLDIEVLDSDGDDVLLIIQSLPEHGVLYVENGGEWNTLTVSAAGVKEVEQYVQEVVNFSTSYGPGPNWHASMVIGEPSTSFYGDTPTAWSPSTSSGMCVNRGDSSLFYTEFLHLRFNTSVYITEVYIYENLSPGAVVGVRAWNEEAGRWSRLFRGEAHEPLKEDAYRIWNPPGMCGTYFKSRELFIELDTCNRPGWNEIDAVLLVGTTDYNKGHVHAAKKVVYAPHSGYTGSDTFEFKLTDCPGNRFYSTESFTPSIQVNPIAQAKVVHVTAEQGSSVGIGLHAVSQFAGVTKAVTALPVNGVLYVGGKTAKRMVPFTEPSVLYRASDALCQEYGDAFEDSFAIASGTATSQDVRVFHIRGCDRPADFPYWVFGVIAGVLVVVAAVVVWKATQQRRRMSALYNNNVMAENLACAVASMNLEEVEYLDTLTNPNRIQAAFKSIVMYLKEYRNFMPASVFVQSTSDEEDGSSAKGLSRVQGGETNSSMSAGSTERGRAQPLHHLSVGLRARRVTVGCVNIRGFMALVREGTGTATSAHAEFATLAVTVSKETKGVCEQFQGDQILVSWNAIIPNLSGSCSACRFAYSTTLRTSSLGMLVKIGLCTSQAHCGNIGGGGMKKFAILGGCTRTAVALCALGCERSMSVTHLQESMVDEVDARFDLTPFTRIVYKKFQAAPFVVYELLGQKEVADEEWMYQLQRSEDPVLRMWQDYLSGKTAAVTVDLSDAHPATQEMAHANNILDYYHQGYSKMLALA